MSLFGGAVPPSAENHPESPSDSTNGRFDRRAKTWPHFPKHGLVVKIEKDGYETVEVNVNPKVAGAGAAGMAGNILVGGLIGAAVDAGSGAMYNLVPNPIQVRLVKLGDSTGNSPGGEAVDYTFALQNMRYVSERGLGKFVGTIHNDSSERVRVERIILEEVTRGGESVTVQSKPVFDQLLLGPGETAPVEVAPDQPIDQSGGKGYRVRAVGSRVQTAEERYSQEALLSVVIDDLRITPSPGRVEISGTLRNTSANDAVVDRILLEKIDNNGDTRHTEIILFPQANSIKGGQSTPFNVTSAEPPEEGRTAYRVRAIATRD